MKTARGVVSLAAVVGFGLAGGGAAAQELDCISPPVGGPADSEMCDLGTLAGGAFSFAHGVNADGSVVVGRSGLSAGNRAFRWVAGEGMESLGTLQGGSVSFAYGVNADGSVVVGWSITSGGDRAFRWVEGEGMENLGTLTGGGWSYAWGVNAVGSVVVGVSNISDGARAFRWVAGEGMESLGTLTGGSSSEALGVNADGSVVVGRSGTSAGTRAFRWVAGAGMENLGTLPGGGFSGAYGVNADGSVVVGTSGTSAGTRAFRWVDGEGMENLGTLAGRTFSQAWGVNADGSVVVGESGGGSTGTRAFRWVAGEGMENLGTLAGGSFSIAYGVNADGSVVVGESGTSAGTRAFIWRGVMEDFENLITSFPVLGNDSAVALAEQQFALGQVMGQSGLAAAGQSILSARAGVQHTGRNPTSVGARTTSLGALSFGRGISDNLTLGASISVNATSLQNNAFDMDTGFGAALWGQYSEGGLARTGLQLGAALGYMRSRGEVARGRLLTDVALATGSATVETRAVQATIGYGFAQEGWLVTPSLGVAHYDTTRAAYTETGAAFNASYDALRTSRTVATLGVTGEVALGEQGRLSLGVGVDHEVKSERPRLTGTSDIPGLATFDIGSTASPNRTRAFATVGYTHDLGNGSSISGNVRVGQAVYGNTPSVGLGITYGMRF